MLLRIASIGSGRRGRICKMAHRPDNGSALVAACDPRAEIRDEYLKEFGAGQTAGGTFFVTDDYRKLLARGNVDAVFVTSPDYLHEEHALACIESGCGVYVEKPLAITLEGCDRILAAAERRGVKIYLGHNLRFVPVFVKMKQLIDAGAIGEVQAIWVRHFIDYGGDAYFKDWCSERRTVNSLLLQKAAHDIDMIHWLAGAYTTHTSAMGKLSVYNRVTHRRTGPRTTEKSSNDVGNWPPLAQTDLSPVIDVEDHNMMLMQLGNGVQASYCQCHYTPDGHRNYTIIGAEGRMENIGDHSTEQRQAAVRVWNTRKGGWREQGDQQFILPPAVGEHGGADPMIIRDFLNYLRTGVNSGANPWDARMSVATGCMATKSLRAGGVMQSVPQTSLIQSTAKI